MVAVAFAALSSCADKENQTLDDVLPPAGVGRRHTRQIRRYRRHRWRKRRHAADHRHTP